MKEIYYIKPIMTKENFNKEFDIPKMNLTLEKAFINIDEKINVQYLKLDNKKYIKSNKKFITIFSQKFLNDCYDKFYRSPFVQYKTIEEFNKNIDIYEDTENYIMVGISILKGDKQLYDVFTFTKIEMMEFLG
jgi:hypothetical protein